MLEMIAREIMPACIAYSSKVASSVATKASIGISAQAEKLLVADLTAWMDNLASCQAALQDAVEAVPQSDVLTQAGYYRDTVLPAMDAARAAADKLETLSLIHICVRPAACKRASASGMPS